MNLAAKMARSLPTPKPLPTVFRILMIASGKGGVGKSTVSANIAIELARRDLRIGLLDADVFGPSIPRLMGLEGKSAELDANGGIMPLMNHGVACASMGFLAEGAVAWRGLMVMRAVQDLMWRVAWPRLDYLIVDTPPGTGDTHLTLLQQLCIDGALVVTIPQPLALPATERGIQLLQTMKCPIIGLVENMKWLECAKCSHQNALHDDSKLPSMLKKYNLDLVASLPMLPEEGDMPVALKGNPHYTHLVDKIIQSLKDKNKV